MCFSSNIHIKLWFKTIFLPAPPTNWQKKVRIWPPEYFHLNQINVLIFFRILRHQFLIATHSYSLPENIGDYENKLFFALWDSVIPVFKLGDLNNDTLINIYDIIMLSDSVLDSVEYDGAADINSDNIVNDYDISVLAYLLLGTDP